MEGKFYNFWVSYEDWKLLKQFNKGVILQEQNSRQVYLVSFNADQARYYTCNYICNVKEKCGLAYSNQRRERFARGVCEISFGPLRDSLVTGRVG